MESEPEEFSILDYARHHGLTIDHTKDNIPELLSTTWLRQIDQPAWDGVDLLKDCPPLKEPKIQCGKEAASLLASIMKPPSAPLRSYELEDYNYYRSFKMDLPILKADHAADMAKLENWSGVPVPKPQPIKQPEPENGDAFSCLTGVVARCENAARHEKMHVSREALMTLQSLMKPPIVTDQMRADFYASEMVRPSVRLNFSVEARLTDAATYI